MSLPLSVFQKLPKTDLHVHLDGSLRISTLLELAEEQGVELPAKTPEGLRRAMHCGENTRSTARRCAPPRAAIAQCALSSGGDNFAVRLIMSTSAS